MSAIFGLVCLNGQPIPKENLMRMSSALAAHGPDGGNVWSQNNVGLGQRLMRFTPEDDFEKQPLLSFDGQRVLVTDGRIDNRPELTQELKISSLEARALPDSAFILRAYEKWGEECVNHLIGLFTFALWDQREKSLFLACSHLGERPLFFHATSQWFAFASMPKGLFALPFVPRELDLTYMADFLTRSLPEEGTTFYHSIRSLPGGHSLHLNFGKPFQIKRYWQFNFQHELRLPKDHDYVDAFNSLFKKVSKEYLRSSHPMGILLSGGLDSSSIAATIAPMLKNEGKHLSAFTEVPRSNYDGPINAGRYADESQFVQSIARMYDNIDLKLVRVNGSMSFEDVEGLFTAVEMPFPNSSNRVWIETIFKNARDIGARVLFGGINGGNLNSSWDGRSFLSELIVQGKWGRALKEGIGIMRESDHHSILRTLASGVMPSLPTPIWLNIRRLRHRNNTIYVANPPWLAYSPIHPEFGKIHRVTERAREKGHEFYGRLRPYTRHLYYRYQLLFSGLSSQFSAGYEAQFGVDWRDPLGDVRIWEFCLSVPEEQYLRDGINRWLIRRAMKDKLPEEVVWNKKRGLQASDYYDRLYASRQTILDELSVLEKSDLAPSVLDQRDYAT